MQYTLSFSLIFLHVGFIESYVCLVLIILMKQCYLLPLCYLSMLEENDVLYISVSLSLCHSFCYRLTLLCSTVLVNLHNVLSCLFHAAVTWIIHKIRSLSSFRMTVRKLIALLWC